MKKSVFVTGAGRGIGRAIALRLSQAGYRVYAASRTLSELQETQRQAKGDFHIQTLDVREPQQIQAWVEGRDRRHPLWGLVSAAGIYGPIGPFVESNWDEWKACIDINLYGTLLAARAVARELVAGKQGGRMVLLSGGGATKPLPNFTAYCASKSAVVRVGETLAHELAPHKITVNSVAPGAIFTRFTEQVIAAGPGLAGRAEYDSALKQRETGGAGPQKASELTEFLLSEAAAAVTGKLIAAQWDPWQDFGRDFSPYQGNDRLTLRRIT